MHPTAKRCVHWSIGLFAIGLLFLAYGSRIYLAIADRAGANAQAGLEILNLIVIFIQNAVFPLAAVLVGAAVVIQTLRPEPTTVPDP